MQSPRVFADWLHPRPTPSGIDVSCGLRHFAIITWAVPAERFAGLWPDRFELDTVVVNGARCGLISAVPFEDVDFTAACFPFPRFTMGQTNYRVYIIDRQTGERAVWFLGTTLDSWTLLVPRYVWQLPWHPGRIRFEYDEDPHSGLYRRYYMHTRSSWAAAEVELFQDGHEPFDFSGFPDTETALVYLTHPLAGFYYRRDGIAGTYRVWHDRLQVRPAQLRKARFELLERLGLVSREEQQTPWSVLLEPLNHFTIYLPPQRLD